MRFKRRYGNAILIIALLCSLSYVTLGADPSIIKVGLVSVYNNVASISLSSDEPMMIGYYDESGFTKLGSLPSEKISITKAGSSYFDLGSIYSTYQEAFDAASTQGGIPVFVDEGLFTVYSKVTNGNPIENNAERYVVTDSYGNELLIFNKTSKALVFRGYDRETGLCLTGVGSSKKYRGAIGIGGSTGITPYNVLGIEEYLYGVVPGEMSASWPEEALKAQAVAARSIALYQYNRYASYGYNVVDTTATQVYGGYTKEDSRTNAAVDLTRGETIKYNGKVAEALYSSTSGGITESAVNVWGSDIPYLVSVPDTYETEPAQPAWSRSITMAEVENCLLNQGVNIGQAQGIQIVSRTPSGRVQEMKIIGSKGEHTVTLEKVRTFFSSTSGGSLKSRLFSFTGELTGSTGGNSEAAQVVSVVSANGITQVPINNLVASNGTTKTTIGSSVVAQSSTGLEILSTTGSSNGNVNLQGETIWGDFTVYGKGFGHGVGMSQSGAKGMAKAGFDYISILKYYYTGITVG